MTAKFFGGALRYERSGMLDNDRFQIPSARRPPNQPSHRFSRNCPYQTKLKLDGAKRQISYQPFGAVSILRGGPYV